MVMNFIRKLMYGRYGSDQLSFFLLVVYIVLILLSGLPHLEVLSWLALAVLLWDLFRMFSRRIDRRRAENARFLALAGPAIRWLRMRRTIAGTRSTATSSAPTADSICGCPGEGEDHRQLPQLRRQL